MTQQYSILITGTGKYVKVKTKSTFSLEDTRYSFDEKMLSFGLKMVAGVELIPSPHDAERYVLKYRNCFLNYDTVEDTFFYSYEQEDLGNRVYASFSLDFICDYLYSELGIIVTQD